MSTGKHSMIQYTQLEKHKLLSEKLARKGKTIVPTVVKLSTLLSNMQTEENLWFSRSAISSFSVSKMF